jgi:hypothetical protein
MKLKFKLLTPPASPAVARAERLRNHLQDTLGELSSNLLKYIENDLLDE